MHMLLRTTRCYHLFLITLVALFPASFISAEIIEKPMTYSHGDVQLEGFVTYDSEKVTDSAPGVLIIHQWMGITDHEKRVARNLADLGYVAFGADIYGKENRPENTSEAGQLSGSFKSNRSLYRERLNLALEQMKALEVVDESRTASIGYCFGGTGVLELARSGADVDAVVSFHGGLDSPTPEDAENIKASVLVCHGGKDPLVSDEELLGLMNELRAPGDIDWQVLIFSQAKHSFTDIDADPNASGPSAYNENADQRSWDAMKDLFEQKFQ